MAKARVAGSGGGGTTGEPVVVGDAFWRDFIARELPSPPPGAKTLSELVRMRGKRSGGTVLEELRKKIDSFVDSGVMFRGQFGKRVYYWPKVGK